jgi:MarR family transcriptional regulator, lower aerobic nicotinate degradation pathway regulator
MDALLGIAGGLTLLSGNTKHTSHFEGCKVRAIVQRQDVMEPEFALGFQRLKESALPQARMRRGESKHRPWPLSERPGFLIRRLHQIHVALFQEACGRFDITPLQYSLLTALAVRKTADQTTLAADIALDRTTTTGALKRLATRRLVERAVDQNDRRARLCRLTAGGKALLTKIEASARAAHRATLENLTEGERALFIEMAQRIVAGNADRAGGTGTPRHALIG